MCMHLKKKTYRRYDDWKKNRHRAKSSLGLGEKFVSGRYLLFICPQYNVGIRVLNKHKRLYFTIPTKSVFFSLLQGTRLYNPQTNYLAYISLDKFIISMRCKIYRVPRKALSGERNSDLTLNYLHAIRIERAVK